MGSDIKIKTLDNSRVVMLCEHCARQSTFEQRAYYIQQDLKYQGDTTIWYLFQCLGCLQPQLIEHYSLVSYDGTLERDSVKLLYPINNANLSGLPNIISREYLAALKVRGISPNACAVLARRTLEVICKHENAEGRNLVDKINNLMRLDRIPPHLAEMAHLGRKIGNLGAHVLEDEVTDEDVETLLDFVEAILEYLYIAPQKISAVKARLDKTP